MVFVYKKLAQFAVPCALPPRRSESPVCATDNKPSCALHLLGWSIGSRGFSSLERRPEFWVLQSLGREDPLEKETATHSSILAWKIPWTEDPGRLQSMGRKESDTTEPLHFTSLTYIDFSILFWGEGDIHLHKGYNHYSVLKCIENYSESFRILLIAMNFIPQSMNKCEFHRCEFHSYSYV